jgi:hypothetical protein
MPQHETLAAALAAFQAELPKLTKDQTAKVRGESSDGRPVNYSYGYAGLDQVTETVSPVLGKHGLSFSSYPTLVDNRFVLTYVLAHESGDARTGTWPLPDPTRTKPQQLGSAITYARRYAFMAVTNTFPGGEDDDGAAAVPTAHRERAMSPEEFQNLPRERPRPQNAPTSPAGPPPAKDWAEASDDEILELHAKLDSGDLEKVGKLYDWMASKSIHTREVGGLGSSTPAVNATTRVAVRLAAMGSDDTATVENLAWLREFADGRGLLKTQVSPRYTLGEWLEQEKTRRVNVELAKSETAQAMRSAAADSWDEQPPEPTIYSGREADGATDPQAQS